MSDEENNLNEELEPEDTQERLQEPEDSTLQVKEPLDEEEKRARSNGYDPTKGNKTAREFNLIGDLIELKNTLKKKDKDIDAILKYQENTLEAQKLRFKAELDYRLQEARANGDVDKVQEITQERLEIAHKEKADNAIKIQGQINEAVVSFANRNSSWYNPQRQDLVAEAVQLEREIITGAYAERTGVPQPQNYDGVLKQIEMAMKYQHPDVIGNQTSRPTLSNSNSSINKTADTDRDDGAVTRLSQVERDMYNTLKRVKGNGYTVKEFMNKVKKDLGDE